MFKSYSDIYCTDPNRKGFKNHKIKIFFSENFLILKKKDKREIQTITQRI